MSGAVQGFTPNMAPAQVADLDRRRGLGDTGAFNDPDILVQKRPWLRQDGTHKSIEEKDDMDMAYALTAAFKGLKIPEGGQDFGKPTLPKREGESESERDVRSHVEDEKNDPDKYPGGRKQAIAIGLDIARRGKGDDAEKGAASMSGEQARRARGRDLARKERTMSVRKNCGCDHEGPCEHEDKVEKAIGGLRALLAKGPPPVPSGTGSGGFGAAGGVVSSAPKPPSMGMAAPKVPKPAAPSNYTRPMGLSPSIKAVACDDAKDGEDKEHIADKLFGKAKPENEKDDVGLLQQVLDHEKEESREEEAKKSLAARLRRLPTTMKAFSSRSIHVFAPRGEYDPFGINRSAMSIPVHTARQADAPVRMGEVYKSCAAHGLTFRESVGCGPCTIEKAQSCASCGVAMNKSFGGVLRCPRGH